ncbi:MAG: SUMF1/EgtB/PvdO family nonheme iron enzyme [Bacteroidetes bacterium]|nr:SUMF1/EgtB/PvdO family nonheme iron enzyme [Bacteroidota bacterium]
MKIKLIIIIVFPLLIFLSGKDVSNSKIIRNTNQELTELVKDSLYVSKYEVTNGQYKVFLYHLKQNGEITKYSECLYDSVVWTKQFPGASNEPMMKYYHSHPAYSNYPASNLTYQSAKHYCAWLTDEYNSSQRRKFEQVLFRLPSEKEWLLAAKSSQYSIYPDNEERIRYHANLKYRTGVLGNFDYASDGGLYATMKA